jgi:hypothetical protein
MTDLVEALQRAHVQLLSEEAELRERWMASS